MDENLRRWLAIVGLDKLPPEFDPAEPSTLDLKYGDRLCQSEMNHYRIDTWRVPDSLAIAIAFDRKSLSHGDTVCNRSLISASNNLSCIDA